MSWSSADFPHEDDQAYRHEHSLVDLSQSPAQLFPYIPLNTGWGWNGGARPGSISAQSTQHPVTSSLVIPTVNESISWDAPPSTYGTYSTLTSIQNHTPNPGLSYLPDSTTASFSHTGYLSPLSPHMEPTRQENYKQNICNRDVRRPIVGIRRHAHPQATNKNTRRPQQYVSLNSIEISHENKVVGMTMIAYLVSL